MSISEGGGQCPRIQFRGQSSIQNEPQPSIYVDGTLMLDTCIITQMSSMEIDFIEVYPSGFSSRPGVQRNPGGVIYIQRVRE
jgi:hypothetical protein